VIFQQKRTVHKACKRVLIGASILAAACLAIRCHAADPFSGSLFGSTIKHHDPITAQPIGPEVAHAPSVPEPSTVALIGLGVAYIINQKKK